MKSKNLKEVEMVTSEKIVDPSPYLPNGTETINVNTVIEKIVVNGEYLQLEILRENEKRGRSLGGLSGK